MKSDKAVILKEIKKILETNKIEPNKKNITKIILCLCCLDDEYIKLFNKFKVERGIILEKDIEFIMRDLNNLDFDYKNHDNIMIKILRKNEEFIISRLGRIIDQEISHLFDIKEIDLNKEKDLTIFDIKKISLLI